VAKENGCRFLGGLFHIACGRATRTRINGMAIRICINMKQNKNESKIKIMIKVKVKIKEAAGVGKPRKLLISFAFVGACVGVQEDGREFLSLSFRIKIEVKSISKVISYFIYFPFLGDVKSDKYPPPVPNRNRGALAPNASLFGKHHLFWKVHFPENLFSGFGK